MKPKTKADLTLPRKPMTSATVARQEPVTKPATTYSPELEKAMDDDMLNDRWYTLHQVAKKSGLSYATVQARLKYEPAVRRGFGPPRIPHSLYVEVWKRPKP